MTSRKLTVLAFALSIPMASCADAGSGNPMAAAADPSMNHACDGSLPYFGRYVATSDNPSTTVPEVEGTLGTGCGYMVLTGVGGTIINDSDYETLWLTGRMLYHDGTWSEPTTRVYGNAAKAQEQYLSVPYGHAIVGLSMGLSGTSDQLTTIQIRHREVQYVNGRLQLVGPVYTSKVGSDPLGNDAIHELPSTNDREVYVGVGARAEVERTKLLIAHTGALY
jgi:hypothetical protein